VHRPADRSTTGSFGIVKRRPATGVNMTVLSRAALFVPRLDGGVRKALVLVLLVCVLLPMQHRVTAQQSGNLRFANDWCYPRVDDNGWMAFDTCEVQIFDAGGGELYISGTSPAWSPDGLRIAYLETNLYVYDRTTYTSVMVAEGRNWAAPSGGHATAHTSRLSDRSKGLRGGPGNWQ
jgi:hypothetical protein